MGRKDEWHSHLPLLTPHRPRSFFKIHPDASKLNRNGRNDTSLREEPELQREVKYHSHVRNEKTWHPRRESEQADNDQKRKEVKKRDVKKKSEEFDQSEGRILKGYPIVVGPGTSNLFFFILYIFFFFFIRFLFFTFSCGVSSVYPRSQ